jgi:hypothetical protein
LLRGALHLPISRLLNGIIGPLAIKHKGISVQSSEKARFVALASGFDANKFYICWDGLNVLRSDYFFVFI